MILFNLSEPNAVAQSESVLAESAKSLGVAVSDLPQISAEQAWKTLLQGAWILDVRAPTEYQQNHFSRSTCLPILSNEERHQVGICYHDQGKEVAIALGHELVSGEIRRQRTQDWIREVEKHSRIFLMCARGGLRSRTAQTWMAECGIVVPRIAGGAKALRQVALSQLSTGVASLRTVVLSGATGSGKTKLLRQLSSQSSRSRVLDLEAIANHRGSAFGAFPTPQPAQAVFENALAFEIAREVEWMNSRQVLPSLPPVWIEDESRMVGQCTLPEELFLSLRRSGVVRLQEPMEVRVANTYREYVEEPLSIQGIPSCFAHLESSLMRIEKRLGGLNTKECLVSLHQCRIDLEAQRPNHEVDRRWIEWLLHRYYDPLYEKSFQRRQPTVLFQGTALEVKEWWQQQLQEYQ